MREKGRFRTEAKLWLASDIYGHKFARFYAVPSTIDASRLSKNPSFMGV
eukprot:COSAG02_NODE_39526_length_416_cov_0.671924_1_plen_48_part_10